MRVLSLKFWCGGWEEGLMENGDKILNMKKRYNMKHINCLLDPTL